MASLMKKKKIQNFSNVFDRLLVLNFYFVFVFTFKQMKGFISMVDVLCICNIHKIYNENSADREID